MTLCSGACASAEGRKNDVTKTSGSDERSRFRQDGNIVVAQASAAFKLEFRARLIFAQSDDRSHVVTPQANPGEKPDPRRGEPQTALRITTGIKARAACGKDKSARMGHLIHLRGWH